MFPTLSNAIEPIQRLVESGENVDCCATERSRVVASTRSSYQRTPVLVAFLEALRLTEWFTTSDSVPLASLRYARRYIRRSPSESSCWRGAGRPGAAAAAAPRARE